tara:strand:- start:394 stop:705 length:312 start_codon:yes stop_codon:yes gene_type:complete
MRALVIAIAFALCLAPLPVRAHHVIAEEAEQRFVYKCLEIEGQRNVILSRLQACRARTSTPAVTKFHIPEHESGPTWLGAALIAAGGVALGVIASVAIIAVTD